MSDKYGDTLINYFNQTKGKNPETWYPHPLIKALALAISGAKRDGSDGNYMGISADADLTGGATEVVIMVRIEASQGRYTVTGVSDLTRNKDLTPEIVDKVIHTESLAEKYEGKDIPNKLLETALSDIDIKAHLIQGNEIDSAISTAKQLVQADKTRDIPTHIAQNILAIKDRNDWNQTSMTVRCTIGSLYGGTVETAQVMITPRDGETLMERWKYRRIILDILEQKFILIK